MQFAALLLVLLAGGAAAPNPQAVLAAAREDVVRAEWVFARQKLEPALERWKGSDADDVWAMRVLYAEVLCGQVRPDEARPYLTELPARLRNSETEVLRLRTLALVEFLERRRELAWPPLEAAIKLASGRHPRLLPFLYDLAADLVNDGKEKERYGRLALDIARRHKEEVFELRAFNPIVFGLILQGRLTEALRIGEPAAAAMRARKLHGRVTKLDGNLGWALMLLGDYDTAKEIFERGYATARRIGAVYDRIFYANWLGNIAMYQRDHAKARERYAEALGLAREVGQSDLEGVVLANLARVALATGSPQDARRFNDEALEVKRKLEDRKTIRYSELVDARIDIAVNELARAKTKLEKIARDESADAPAKWEARARLAELFIKTGRHDEAVQQFRLSINTAAAARAAVNDQELRLTFFRLVDDIFDTYVDYLIGRDRIDDALQATELMRAQSLEEELQPADLRKDPTAIARQAKATILAFSLGATRSHLWVVTPDKTTHVVLPPEKTIETAIDDYQRQLRTTSGTLEKSGARGAALYRMLLPGVQLQRDARVIVVPDGRLHGFNLETLVVGGRYWIEDVIVMTAPSLALLAGPAPVSRANPSALIVGDPALADPSFPRLPNADDEVRAVAKHFRSTTLTGANATPARYRAASPDTYDYLHFAAHGVASRRRPLDSAVILARDENGSYKLEARRIMDQKLRARLVTISSCHGAGTRAYAGEGLIGLAWAFLRAGADEVIAALWEVDDQAALKVMDALYAEIRAGREPAVALRNAKLSLMRMTKVYRKPDYWAPFVLYAR